MSRIPPVTPELEQHFHDLELRYWAWIEQKRQERTVARQSVGQMQAEIHRREQEALPFIKEQS